MQPNQFQKILGVLCPDLTISSFKMTYNRQGIAYAPLVNNLNSKGGNVND
jgi:hypothetical protein